ncbi:hypothetical protein JAAARDRAFT_37999 [Jaapia argillacea MUCL 33604]|uniref:Uncharacterized protein n=1 Tax=Jaapia argillacea MUCL 33604 TaxID=933084 RepID=A0A067PUB7_9AGAM|nr:hypothetical protein JAAARDRAFT_37999 [Jaapia argillacea MUCL 33604]
MMSSVTSSARPSTRLSISPIDEQVRMDWILSERVAQTLDSHSPTSSSDDDFDAASIDDFDDHDPNHSRYYLIPPIPDCHERNISSSSTITSSSLEDMSRGPCLSLPHLTYPQNRRRQRVPLSPLDEKDEQGEERFLWTIGRPQRPKENNSKKSAPSSHTNHRVVFPKRRRSSSTSSSSSACQTKGGSCPRSILSRSPSSATAKSSPSRRSPPSIKSVKSVKFVDEPTFYPDRPYHSQSQSPPPPLPTPADVDQPGVLSRLKRSLSKPQLAPERPVISGPFPLWEAPSLVDRGSSKSSIRSTRSSSGSNRIRKFWDRLTSHGR